MTHRLARSWQSTRWLGRRHASTRVPHAFHRVLRRAGLRKGHDRLAVAVSGGADSLLLCLVAQEWWKTHPNPPLALIVDHGLRHESQDECHLTKQRLEARGIEACILQANVQRGSDGVQAGARRARTLALGEACAARNIAAILTGHHANDQVETLLLRLARASGVVGLAGMQPMTWMRVADHLAPIRMVKPFLDITKADIIDELRARGQMEWVSDPSNVSHHFDRVRTRTALSRMMTHDLPFGSLVHLVKQCQSYRDDLLSTGTKLLQLHALPVADFGAVLLHVDALQGMHEEVLASLLGRIIACVKGSSQVPVESTLVRAFARRLGAGDAMLGRVRGTPMGGCSLDCVEQHVETGAVRVLLIRRNADLRQESRVLLRRAEASRVRASGIGKPGDGFLEAQWDNRFDMCVSRNAILAGRRQTRRKERLYVRTARLDDWHELLYALGRRKQLWLLQPQFVELRGGSGRALHGRRRLVNPSKALDLAVSHPDVASSADPLWMPQEWPMLHLRPVLDLQLPVIVDEDDVAVAMPHFCPVLRRRGPLPEKAVSMYVMRPEVWRW